MVVAGSESNARTDDDEWATDYEGALTEPAKDRHLLSPRLRHPVLCLRSPDSGTELGSRGCTSGGDPIKR
jgi:hypothetical protein